MGVGFFRAELPETRSLERSKDPGSCSPHEKGPQAATGDHLLGPKVEGFALHWGTELMTSVKFPLVSMSTGCQPTGDVSLLALARSCAKRTHRTVNPKGADAGSSSWSIGAEEKATSQKADSRAQGKSHPWSMDVTRLGEASICSSPLDKNKNIAVVIDSLQKKNWKNIFPVVIDSL